MYTGCVVEWSLTLNLLDKDAKMTNTERWTLILYGCFTLMVCNVLGGYEHICSSATYEDIPKGALCGSKLADAVSLVCGGLANVYRSGRRKRDAPSDVTAFRKRREIVNLKTLNPAGKQSPSVEGVVNKRKAASYLQKRNMYDEKGIVCECCYNSCEIFELQEYCNY